MLRCRTVAPIGVALFTLLFPPAVAFADVASDGSEACIACHSTYNAALVQQGRARATRRPESAASPATRSTPATRAQGTTTGSPSR